MKKKILTTIGAAVLSVTLAAIYVFTANASGKLANSTKSNSGNITGQSYVDSNNDGICDNRITQKPTATFAQTTATQKEEPTTKENTTNKTSAKATAKATSQTPTGPNYVDSNGDGVCDNRGSNQCFAPQDGTGYKRCASNGRGGRCR
jgi:hypothetical protein